MDWAKSIQQALDFIESNLMSAERTISENDAALAANVSPIAMQKFFSLLTGQSLSDYIRERRMTVAVAELKKGRKVIDVALDCGYDSPDSFSRAFFRFHGLLPSEVKGSDARFNARSPLHVKLTLEGGNMLDYKMIHKPEITLLGFHRHFDGTPSDELRAEQEEMLFTGTRAKQWMLCGMASSGGDESEYVVMNNITEKGYDCWYAVNPSRYEWNNMNDPKVTGIEFMDRFGFEKLTIPASDYVVFRTERKKHPVETYISLRKRIAAEFLPGSGCNLNDSFELAVYHWAAGAEADQRYIEIMMPIAAK